jgi:hypothetical protein
VIERRTLLFAVRLQPGAERLPAPDRLPARREAGWGKHRSVDRCYTFVAPGTQPVLPVHFFMVGGLLSGPLRKSFGG